MDGPGLLASAAPLEGMMALRAAAACQTAWGFGGMLDCGINAMFGFRVTIAVCALAALRAFSSASSMSKASRSSPLELVGNNAR